VKGAVRDRSLFSVSSFIPPFFYEGYAGGWAESYVTPDHPPPIFTTIEPPKWATITPAFFLQLTCWTRLSVHFPFGRLSKSRVLRDFRVRSLFFGFRVTLDAAPFPRGSLKLKLLGPTSNDLWES